MAKHLFSTISCAPIVKALCVSQCNLFTGYWKNPSDARQPEQNQIKEDNPRHIDF